VQDVVQALKKKYSDATDKIFEADSPYNTLRLLADDYVHRSGLRKFPQVLFSLVCFSSNLSIGTRQRHFRVNTMNNILEYMSTSCPFQALLNGVPIEEKFLNADDFDGAVVNEMHRQTPIYQKAFFRRELRDSDNEVNFIMSRPNVMPRYLQ